MSSDSKMIVLLGIDQFSIFIYYDYFYQDFLVKMINFFYFLDYF